MKRSLVYHIEGMKNLEDYLENDYFENLTRILFCEDRSRFKELCGVVLKGSKDLIELVVMPEPDDSLIVQEMLGWYDGYYLIENLIVLTNSKENALKIKESVEDLLQPSHYYEPILIHSLDLDTQNLTEVE